MASEAAELSTVIGDIYDAAIDPALWNEALGRICAFVGGSSAALLWHDSATERSEALHLFNVDPHYLRLYFDQYLPLNPMFPAATFVDEGVVVADEDIMPRADLNKTRFYKEWIKPQGTLGALSVNLEKGVARASMINVRMTVPLRDEMRRRLGLLVPHLQRAVKIGRLFDQKSTAQRALTKTLDHIEAAVFLVGAKGQIVFANDMAKKMLGEGALVTKDRNILQAALPAANRTLASIFRSAEKGDASVGVRGVALPLTNKSQDRWFAHVLPLTSGRRQQAADSSAAVAAVFIRRTLPNALSPLEGIAKHYGLSAGEVRVFDAVLKVKGVKEIAELLGLSQSTVKTHLQNVFLKTRTKRQIDLVKLVAGL
jgi:DNA-binding CsgD family transcriptional regulator/PAS domain-containing protein